MRSLLKVIKQIPQHTQKGNGFIEIPAGRPSASMIEGEETGQGQGRSQSISYSVQAAYDEIIGKAKQDSEVLVRQMLDNAKRQCEEMSRNARREVAELRQQAWDDGFQEAVKELREQVTGELSSMNNLLAEMKLQHHQFMEAYQKALQDLAIDVASRILSHRIEENPVEMVDLINEAVGSVKDAEWMSVDLSKQMTGLVQEMESVLAKENHRSIEVNGRELPKGACLITTPEGQIDASIGTQLENLRKQFQKV